MTKNNIEVTARELSTSTNFNGRQIQTQKELFEFAEQVDFPAHGLILKKSKDENTDIYKGITESEILQKSFNYFFSKYNSVYAETNIRAMYNPTRMSVIEQATQKLVQKLNQLALQCQTSIFGITDAKKGLECSLCSSPTNSTISYIYVCQQCKFTKEEMYPNKKITDDPTYCDYCNS